MTPSEQLGFLLWGLIFAWALLGVMVRRSSRPTSASPSTKVSRNASRTSRQTGPAWEQDVPYAECFEDTPIGDDL